MAQVAATIVLLVAGGFLYHRYAPRHVPRGQPALTYLSTGTLDDLRAAFNAESDQTRLLLLLSPTCTVCLRGASAVEDILSSTSRPVRVLVVWEPVIKTDLAPPTTSTLSRISDLRAMQYWDPDRALSAHLVSVARAEPSWVRPEDRERFVADDFIVWDAAIVFPPGSRWDSTLPQPSFSGGPVVDNIDTIRAALSER